MNLRSRHMQQDGAKIRTGKLAEAISLRSGASLFSSPMSYLSGQFFKVAALVGVVFGSASEGLAQANYTTNGTEYAIVGSLPGDQVWPDVALSTNGGVVVWQDNATDGNGWGISARRVDSTLSGAFGTFRVNVQGSNDQQNAKVALLKNGGAVFVWQGGKKGSQHIYARYLSAADTWLAKTDLQVTTFTNFQINPAVTVLNNGNVVVVWSSFNQARTNGLLDVYAKILSPSGGTVKAEFLVNQFISFNQRTPQVAALKDGGFVVTWVSEQQRVVSPAVGTNGGFVGYNSVVNPSVDIYARIFQANGTASGNEFIVSSGNAPCANPAVAAGTDGRFMIAWSVRDTQQMTNVWDVCARSFGTNGVGGLVAYANQRLAGNQFAPRISCIGTDYLVVWTSMIQDGSREGVYGRFLRGDGTAFSDEFRVNTTTASQQIQPAVAADNNSQYAVIWTSFTGEPNNFDLFAQRYVNVDSMLAPMPAPFVFAPFVLSNNVYQPRLQVSWAPLAGITLSNYEVYVDGGSVPFLTTSNVWFMTAADGLTTNSTHAFRVGYVKPGGLRPPLSGETQGTTWSGSHWQGIPFEWMRGFYGDDINQWPAAGSTLGANGPKLSHVFLTGGSPLDSASWLTTHLTTTKQGVFLSWNTQPGLVYQVQSSTNFTSWGNLGSPRFAAGNSDSVYLGNGNVGFYRVLLVR